MEQYVLPIECSTDKTGNRRQRGPILFIGYKYNCLWPLRQDASFCANILRVFGVVMSLSFYVFTVYGEFVFLATAAEDIPAFTDCLSTTFMGVQFFFRNLIILFRNSKMRQLLERFYKEVYIKETVGIPLHANIKPTTRIIAIASSTIYVPALLLYVMFLLDVCAKGMESRDKPYLYRCVFNFYDSQAPIPYIITSIITGWLTVSTVGIMSSDDYLICVMLLHTSQRYKQLQWDLYRIRKQALASGHDVHLKFRQSLRKIWQQEQELNSFVQEAKSQFTHQIFYTMIFGVLLLCVVMFQFQNTKMGIGWLKFILWLIAQSAELFIIGYFGQILMNECENLSLAYYQCGWEQLLPFGDQISNKFLLRDIQFSIMNTTNPLTFDGYKLFTLTHRAIGMAFRSAMSYFMFLNTMSAVK